jgi:hypothetical protein
METDERTSSIKPAGVMAMALRIGDQTQHGKPQRRSRFHFGPTYVAVHKINKYILTQIYIYRIVNLMLHCSNCGGIICQQR